MVTLHYPPMTDKIANWQDRLERMVIEHQLVPQEELTEPQLQYGEDFIQGTASIDAYLDKLEDLVKSWYECRCDKYEF
jgi:hypothetical protein